MQTDVTQFTPSELYEELQREVGVPAYNGDEPYQRWRIRQIATLRNVMNKQRVTIEEALLCAKYIKVHKKRTESYGGLFRWLYEARAWDQQRNSPTSLELQVDEAVDYERTLADGGETDWMVRLVRALPERRAEVLAEWRVARQL